MTHSYSLHRARKAQACHWCGDVIPTGGEYWRLATSRSVRRVARILCCICHVLYDLPTCGWERPADGDVLVTGKLPLRALAGEAERE